jgi:hypothetical protein
MRGEGGQAKGEGKGRPSMWGEKGGQPRRAKGGNGHH